ncbi:MAG: long-chain-fatty-acid--CoA ligase [Deltaproteobacteria bacterium]|nr:long-chain-fatty-acid--CoA ligase [Deltaproteobacteria bacterium]
MPVSQLEDVIALKNKRLEFDSIAQMFTVRAREIPKRTHVLYYDQKITYAQTNERANKIANYLKEKGIKKGDVVSLMISNSPEIYYVMFGTQKIGAIAGVINFALMGPEIAHVLDDSKPKIVFVGSEFMASFSKAYHQAGHKPVVVEVKTEAKFNSDIAEETLLDILDKYPADEALVEQNPGDPFLLLYSSGTTGLPKGILLSNQGQFDICHAMSVIGLVTSDNETMLILLPMYHTNPICVWTYPLTFMGQTLCIRKGFSPDDFWPAILDNNITILMGVPAMYNYVYYSIDASTIDLSKLKLKFAFSGAAPLSVDLINGFKEKFDVEIIEGYGLTESVGVSAVNPPEGKRKAGSCGLSMPGQEIEIMDDDNTIVPAGEKGEVCIKGTNNMIEYLNNPKATKETIIDGWLHTGDIGYIDEEGFLFVVDRKKDMINRGGENIYPREIEMVIEAHPDVMAVAVIGVPDDAMGERVKAVIEPSKPDILTKEIVKAYLKDKLAKYKIPEFIEITDKIPRNPTGKILKYKLREKMENNRHERL